MNTIEDQLTDALRRRDAELDVRDELDAILDAHHHFRAQPTTEPGSKRSTLLVVAAASLVAVGIAGLTWATNDTQPTSNATEPTNSQTITPAGFPRLQLPDPSAPADRRLAGAQDYPIEGGWFSFQNYDQELDLDNDGTPTRRGTFSIAILTGTAADADRAACAMTPEVIDQDERTISIYQRGQEARRFIWNEAPGVYVVVDTQLIDQSEGLAAISSLEPVNETAWQQRLSTLPSADIVTTPDGSDAEGSDSIWWYYTTDQPIEPATTIPGESTQPNTALC